MKQKLKQNKCKKMQTMPIRLELLASKKLRMIKL